jgi:hypothetical protein
LPEDNYLDTLFRKTYKITYNLIVLKINIFYFISLSSLKETQEVLHSIFILVFDKPNLSISVLDFLVFFTEN